MTHRGKDFSQAHGLQKERFVSTLCGMCGPGPACGIYALVSEGRFIGNMFPPDRERSELMRNP